MSEERNSLSEKLTKMLEEFDTITISNVESKNSRKNYSLHGRKGDNLELSFGKNITVLTKRFYNKHTKGI